jgi:hypothetical protein
MRLASCCHPGRHAGGQTAALAGTLPLVVVGDFAVEDPPPQAPAASNKNKRRRTQAARCIPAMIAERN